MNRILPALALAACLTACGSADAPNASDAPSAPVVPSAEPGKVYDQELPFNTGIDIEATRGKQDPCPYIDGTWLENTNGQKLTGSGLDTRFDTPACVFWSFENDPQATVLVRHMPTDDDAIAVVDFFAPIDTTQPADLPGDWMGGRQGGDTGALYAVQAGNVAVVVHTAQQQSVKAELIAKEVIKNLGY